MAHTVITAEEVKKSLADTDVTFMRLWDIYGGLLTDTQKEITRLYFECDLSLAEIAEEKGMSRAGVSDCLHKSRKKLEEADEKLHFIRMLDELSNDYSSYLTDVLRWAIKQEEAHPEWKDALLELRSYPKGEDVIEIVDETR